VREVQPSHVRLKTPVVRDAGDQLSKNPDGKDVSELQLAHACVRVVAREISMAGKDVREEQPCHAYSKRVPDEVSSSGKDVREEQLYHAA
jgi:hypothetical protein